MPDSVLAGYLVALCMLAAAWWVTIRRIVSRLRERHPAKFATIFGTPERRKNEMDKFVSTLAFLFEDQAALRDWRLLLACVMVKAFSVLWLLVFAAMVFTPFFLHLGE
jgi:hypothetical protein